MDINNINSARANSINSLVNAALDGENVTPRTTPSPILGGDSVTVTASSGTSDIEKLAALLLQESNKAHEDSLLSRLKSLSENGLFDALLEQVNGKAKGILTEMDQVSTDSETTEANLETAKNDKVTAETTLQAAKEAKKQAEQNLASVKADEDASADDIAAAEKAVNDAATEVSKAETALKNIENKINRLTKQLNDQNAEIVELAGELDLKSYRLLMDVLKLDSELRNYQLNTMEDSSDKEDVERGGNVPLSERSPLAIIRDALRRGDGEFLNTLETRRENHI